MSRPFQTAVAFLLIALTVCTGCHPTQPFFFSQDNDLSHYLDKATQIEYPDVDTATLADAKETREPLTVSNPEFTEIWDVTLQECVNIAMQNSKVIRSLQAVVAVPPFTNGMLQTTQGASTIYDSALASTTVPAVSLVRNSATQALEQFSAASVGGVEAALAEFDATLNVRATVPDQTNRPVFSSTQPFPIQGLIADAYHDTVRTDLSKKTATGATFTFSNQSDRNTYSGDITPPTGIARSYWTTSFEARVDQPLLRGRGTQINRIPIVVARINEDISLSQFEIAVRNLMMDLEQTYWDLHLAYRNLETAKISRDSAQVAWRIARGKNPGPGSAAEEAQATEQYFNFRGMVENNLRELYNKENQLRFLMGLAATDGRLIRPIDEPTMARVSFDWHAINAEVLLRSPELRQQKWILKQHELELVANKNLLLPKLDATAIYKTIGVGNELNSGDPQPRFFTDPGSGALQHLGDWHELFVQFEFTMPVGFRRELARVRHGQLQVARDKAHLEDMELNATNMLTQTIRNVDCNYVLAQTHFNRWSAAETELHSLRAQYEGGKITLYELLDAQRRRAQAQGDFYKAVTDHSKAIAEVHYRKGSLLEFNNISLAEGPWAQKAYWDAMEKARERDASYYLDYGFTRPNVVSLGPVPQEAAMSGSPISSIVPSQPTPADGLPVPEETPAEQDLGRPTEGDSILNKPEPAELGPVTGDPSGPVLNAPATRTADSGMAQAMRQSQKSSFDWDTLNLDAKSGPAPARSGVVPAGYSSQIGDHR